MYRVYFTRIAKEMLKSIPDRRIREKIRTRAMQLAVDPDKQGKPLSGELEGYRTVRTVGQRYRIVFRIGGKKVEVLVVGIGIRKDQDRKDIYTLTKKLIRLGLLESD